MIKVGITGGIGSGKTTISKIFETLNIPLFNADIEAKKLFETEEVKKFYLAHFGDAVFSENKLDRQKISNILFSAPDKLMLVNSFIHPLVVELFDNWTIKHINADYVLKESAILFETGLYKDLDYNILVTAPVETRIKRIIERDKLPQEQIELRMANQWTDEAKVPLADFVIENEDNSLVIKKVLDIHQKILASIKK
ncbi:MAG TPA: dephospho-CoA kinase [Bacteroidales bacterium]